MLEFSPSGIKAVFRLARGGRAIRRVVNLKELYSTALGGKSIGAALGYGMREKSSLGNIVQEKDDASEVGI